MGSSSHTALIPILDRDKIHGEVPHVLYLHRHNLLGEDQDGDAFVFWEYGKWVDKLAHVCQRWRNVKLLGSASYLGLSHGTPVADMQHCLELDGGPVLPELQELTHLVRGNTNDLITSSLMPTRTHVLDRPSPRSDSRSLAPVGIVLAGG
jgi:hypothetical protein